MWFLTKWKNFLYLGYEFNVTIFSYICIVFKLIRESGTGVHFISKLCNSNFGIPTASLNSFRSSSFCKANGHKNMTFHKSNYHSLPPPPHKKHSYLQGKV